MGLTGLVWVSVSTPYHCYLLLALIWVSFQVSSPFYRTVRAEALSNWEFIIS